MNTKYVGDGKVILIAGGGKTYIDKAAKFCRSSKSIEEIIGVPEDIALLDTIIHSPHKAVLEFDDYIFGIEGYSRVAEVQLVRKRHASYMISSGRTEKKGRRTFDVVLPQIMKDNPAMKTIIRLTPDDLSYNVNYISLACIEEIENLLSDCDEFPLYLNISPEFLLKALEQWYNNGINHGISEEDLRYLKPQATEFKACVKMNVAALKDWFAVRMCNRAQTEIRDLANKIYQLCLEAQPNIFKDMGPNCKVLGYCPENEEQYPSCRGKIPTQEEAMKFLKENWKLE